MGCKGCRAVEEGLPNPPLGTRPKGGRPHRSFAGHELDHSLPSTDRRPIFCAYHSARPVVAGVGVPAAQFYRGGTVQILERTGAVLKARRVVLCPAAIQIGFAEVGRPLSASQNRPGTDIHAPPHVARGAPAFRRQGRYRGGAASLQFSPSMVRQFILKASNLACGTGAQSCRMFLTWLVVRFFCDCSIPREHGVLVVWGGR